MEDVPGVYEKPYDPKEPVVCQDEKPINLHTDVRLPRRPRRDARPGATANTSAGEPKAGKHFCFPTPDRTGFQFAPVAVKLAMSYPEATRIHLVLDNLNIHCQKSLTDAFGSQMGSEVWERFAIHHTLKHGSRLNQAEIEIGIFAKQCLGKRGFQTSGNYARKVRLGAAALTRPLPKSIGGSIGQPHGGRLGINANLSSGRSTRAVSGGSFGTRLSWAGRRGLGLR